MSSGRTSASIVVVAERLLVLLQAQPAQPSPDVHPRPPDRACSPPWAQSIPSRAGTDTTDGPATAVAEGALVLSGSSPIAGKAVRVAFDGGRLTSDAGVLVLADIERRLGHRRAPGALPRRTRGRRSGCTTRWPR